PTMADSFKGLAGAIGEAFGPALLEVAGYIQNLEAWIRGLDDATKSNIVKWVGWTAAIGGGVFVVGRLGAMLAGVLVPALTGLKVAVSGLDLMFNRAFGSPIIAGIATLTTTVVALGAAFFGVKSAVEAVNDAIDKTGSKKSKKTPEQEEKER